jgi:hypothetical protein
VLIAARGGGKGGYGAKTTREVLRRRKRRKNQAGFFFSLLFPDRAPRAEDINVDPAARQLRTNEPCAVGEASSCIRNGNFLARNAKIPAPPKGGWGPPPKDERAYSAKLASCFSLPQRFRSHAWRLTELLCGTEQAPHYEMRTTSALSTTTTSDKVLPNGELPAVEEMD